MPRDTISHGAIAGAVVGSVAGLLLILLCLSPFIRRAIRQRTQRRHHPKSEGSDTPAPFDGSRRISDGQFLQAASAEPQLTEPKEDVQQSGWHKTLSDGSPSAPPHPWQSDPWWREGDSTQPASTEKPTAEEPKSPLPVSPDTAQQPASEGFAPVDSRETASPHPPPQADEETIHSAASDKSSHHHHHIHLPHALQHVAEAVRRQTNPEFGPPSRSVTWDQDQDQYLTPSQSAPTILDSPWIDDPNGAAYEYYHDPDLLSESPASESGPRTQPLTVSAAPNFLYQHSGAGSAPAGIEAVPRTHLPGLTESPHQIQQVQASAADGPQGTAPSPRDDSTVSPDTPTAKRPNPTQTGSARGRLQELRTGSLDSQLGDKGPRRMDTLPPTGITADSPVAGQGVPDIPTPSINPMAIMPASNPAEQTHRVQHELDVIQQSPPRQQQQQQVFTANVIQPSDDPLGELDADGVSEYYNESDDGQEMDVVDYSDYSSAPPFSPPSNPSFENTPATRISDSFSPSPSPGLPPHPHDALAPAEMNPHQTYLSPQAHPDSPQLFRCEICGREFDLYHKLNHHRRYHDRPHECPHKGCDKRFGTKTHLDRHINDKHDKRRKYYCMVAECPYSRQGGKAFPRKDNWRRHMQNKHQITPDGEPGPEFVEDETMTGI